MHPSNMYAFVVRNQIYEKESCATNKWHCRRKPSVLTELNRVVISIACVYDNLSKALISEFGLHIVAWVLIFCSKSISKSVGLLHERWTDNNALGFSTELRESLAKNKAMSIIIQLVIITTLVFLLSKTAFLTAIRSRRYSEVFLHESVFGVCRTNVRLK